MNKKSWTLVTVLIGGIFLGSPVANAEEFSSASSDLGFTIEDGGTLELLAVRPLTFDTVTYSAQEQAIYPIINDIHVYQNSFASSYLLPSDYLGPANYSGFSLVDVADNRIGENNSWALGAKLTNATNKETGKTYQIGLKINQVSDLFNKSTQTGTNGFFSLDSASQTYTKVFELNGAAAQGAHPLDFFADFQLVDNSNISTYAISPGIYTTKNVSLVIPAATDMDPGSYSATIQWTLTDTPSEIPFL